MSANQLVAPHLERLTESYFDFQPDIIIEATNACNRACHGCYAANILVNKNNISPLAKFLDSNDLKIAMNELNPSTVSIRGGEPSIHPNIKEILEVATAKSEVVVLETHGRWIIHGAPLLSICKELGIYIKVSFDSMHGLSEDQLYKIHDTLRQNEVNYLVAVTESSYSEFLATRTRCSWIPNGQIIFQKKVIKLGDLIQPKIGVVKTDGTFNRTLSVKNSFLPGGRND